MFAVCEPVDYAMQMSLLKWYSVCMGEDAKFISLAFR